MAGRLAAAHIVIGRSGASTVCELAVAGKPSILVPLQIAADDHQRFNARLLEDVDAAAVARENELTVDSLAGALKALLSDSDWLERMSAGARSVARPRAAEDLADLVERTATGG
jgi:UDP-N-acetylglucosamine--N-acetylmuramyl-(pentapeptide) pyrophosphoryl-undecaprenol N-acetylglucosamine transferase